MRKDGLPFLILLLLLVAVSAFYVHRRVLKHVDQASASPVEEAGIQRTEIPVPERLSNPHVVLVLDISGSMRGTDPSREQARAAAQFFVTYRDLLRETLADGEEGRLAVVLFSTIAQVVDWTGSDEPWLVVEPGTTDLFEQFIADRIGTTGPEVRVGERTDFRAALDAVDRLVAGLQSPPAVVFMTDGLFDPHPFFNPAVARETRRSVAPDRFDASLPVIESVEQGRLRFIPATGEPRAFQLRTLGMPDLPTPPHLKLVYSRTVIESREGLLARRFQLRPSAPDACLFWSVVFLGIGDEGRRASEVRDLLAPRSSCPPWRHDTFVHTTDARELARYFISALSGWFRLHEQPVAAGATRLLVPPGTQAFAMYVETTGPTQGVSLRQPGSSVQLAGRAEAWAGVAAGTGEWALETGGVAVRGGSVFLRPRYDWVLAVPQWFGVRGGSDSLAAELYLFSLERREPTPPGEILQHLPDQLPLRATYSATGESWQGFANRVAGPDSLGPIFEARIPATGRSEGSVSLTVDLAAIAQRIPIPAAERSVVVELRPWVRPVVHTAEGNPSGLHLRGVPREAARVRAVRERF